MHKKILLIILSIFTLLFVIGCNKASQALDISEFSISYLEVQDDKYLVENEVSIQAKVENANEVQLLVREYGENEIEETISGEKADSNWEFSYENSEPFMKEVWLVAENSTGKTIQSPKKIITNQDQSYENAFENIVSVSKEIDEDIRLSKHTVNFSILGWYNSQDILGYNNQDLILYNVNNNQPQTIREDVWNVYPSPNFKKVIYEDNDGIHFLDIAKENNKKIFSTEHSTILKDLVWSGNGENVLLNVIENKKNSLYIVNLVNGDFQSIDLNFLSRDVYSLEKFISFEGNNLYALGTIVDENNKQMEISKVLLRLNIHTRNIKNYTLNMQPIDEIKILSPINNNEFLIRLSSQVISEEEIQSNNDIYLLNTKNGIFKSMKEDIDYPYVYSLSPDKNSYVYLKNVVEDGNIIPNKKFIVLGKRHKKETTILQAVEYFPTAFYWSEDAKRMVFYMNNTKELYYIENKS